MLRKAKPKDTRHLHGTKITYVSFKVLQWLRSEGATPATPLSLDNENKFLSSPVREHLGRQLREFYHGLVGDALLGDLAALVCHLERVIEARSEADDPQFRVQLLEAVLTLQAYAISLPAVCIGPRILFRRQS